VQFTPTIERAVSDVLPTRQELKGLVALGAYAAHDDQFGLDAASVDVIRKTGADVLLLVDQKYGSDFY
jgi:hypothetical protein